MERGSSRQSLALGDLIVFVTSQLSCLNKQPHKYGLGLMRRKKMEGTTSVVVAEIGSRLEVLWRSDLKTEVNIPSYILHNKQYDRKWSSSKEGSKAEAR